MGPAVALLEFTSVAIGIRAGDGMVKRAPLDLILTGTAHPGKYLVLVAGDTASVEEAVAAGRAEGSAALVDVVLLPDIHPAVVAALAGAGEAGRGEALGIVETRTVAAVVEATDAARKGAAVELSLIRLADGLGGKGYALFRGAVADVEAAVAIASARVGGGDRLVAAEVIARLHPEMLENLEADPVFARRSPRLSAGDA